MGSVALSSCFTVFLHSVLVTLYNPGGLFNYFPKELKEGLNHRAQDLYCCMLCVRYEWKGNEKLLQGKYVFFLLL